ncbi:MAG: glucoamylase family protein [Ignavibacteriaceae bacterium]
MKITLLIIPLFLQIIRASVLDTIPPAAPSGVQCISYEYHMDIIWSPNSESDLAGYKIYKEFNGTFSSYVIIQKEYTFFMEQYGTIGDSARYKVLAYDYSGNESPLSEIASGKTKPCTDEEFLDMVQRATFRFFWDYGHPVSGLTRERLGSGNTVTSGGSGFGIMAYLVGIERGFITRESGQERMLKTLNFLITKADKFHGVFSHWLNGETGAVIPFSTYDNGGDLVETSYMIQGLLAAKQYFDRPDTTESKIRTLIDTIVNGVEWTWYRRASFSPYLYWHWSPNYGWQINMKLVGWNETMIAYILGMSSPTYPILKSSYYNGWTSSGSYANGNWYFTYKLWVGPAYGGPLFFSHYSFLGFDPRDKKDNYTNYFNNAKHHTLIHKAYCTVNPKSFPGYNQNSWGLTACDNPWGYSAHEPYNNDNGTIAPTAAISSIAYTPTESIELIKYLYRTHKNKLWGNFGFKDAFNLNQNWFAGSYISIDQGPIIIMIENYRSQLLWNNFMKNPEIRATVDSIFVPDLPSDVEDISPTEADFELLGNYPNPFNPSTNIVFNIDEKSAIQIRIFNINGETIDLIEAGVLEKGEHEIRWTGENESGNEVNSGVYFYEIKTGTKSKFGKMIFQK